MGSIVSGVGDTIGQGADLAKGAKKAGRKAYLSGVANNLITGENKDLTGTRDKGAADYLAAQQQAEKVQDSAKTIQTATGGTASNGAATGGGVNTTQATEDKTSVAGNANKAYKDKMGYGAYGFPSF